MKKFVYDFNEGTAEMKSLLGGKGANLGEMTKIGLPVPGGFTVTTEACNEYYVRGAKLWDELKEEIFNHLAELEGKTGKKLGDLDNPLLVSVRSGSVFSMPGMMDTILNLGLNDKSVVGMANATDNKRFAYDSYRRFIQMFGDVVLEIPKYKFDTILHRRKNDKGIEHDTELTWEDLRDISELYKEVVRKEKNIEFPQDTREQLLMATEAVFKSWNNPRAIIYRRLNDIPNHLGTAVNIQSMVFGNMGDTCGTGVAFTRNPSTGENLLYGEFLLNAQGEDVVAGIRTPKPIAELDRLMPEAYQQFVDVCNLLEKHYRDMQDIEFTIENKNLYVLQTRNGKRTAAAAINIAVEMVEEGLITKEEAIMRVEPNQLDQLLHPTFDSEQLAKSTLLTKGLPASSGAASGKAYFTPEDVVHANSLGEKAILLRTDTSPEDLEGMVACQGILTARGGMTSHAAVVARGMGKCCIVGAGEIRIDEESKTFTINGRVYNEGHAISLDGNTGDVYDGEIPTKSPELIGNFEVLMAWADEIRKLKIRTNADTPKDTKQAIIFGAEGIGLCRTEHMFFEESRIAVVRQMILSRNVEERKDALEQLLPMQRQDFIEIFREMGSRPVTVRLLDPPLHEFLPHEEEDIVKLAKKMNISVSQLKNVVAELKEVNPMLGHRGCRLAVTYPEIYEMQVRAILEAAIILKEEENLTVIPEIMVPLVGQLTELKYIKNLMIKTANEVIQEKGVKIDYLIGTMIEVPRAAITADEIAEEAEFFSFGTNDLTQMTFGFSRDDAGRFIGEYVEKNILEKDPFQRLDRAGVGKLIKIAADLGKQTRPNIKLGICGEHGGDPSSIEFCHQLGLDYVSCSPFRVPIARLAAAQAALRLPQK
ncbi:pyruvate, phosphate dikinase [Serpentinicella alkaliphila]|uniref:Pyruvate, phosphate dikinase n=2 Tax=Serpentinicella alkaliphila TaxID=1734049 RepID=A0A4R2UJZ0_9FIRM|nr:pyruvate, phosphate dikinase [Serpentinicella alkaliphila]QUH26890.1 pyruvate, phosphate dikinase [Serpentinicella alkaliphila]TCQ08123.1 pyruvate phosphate dikinase [Serpentinicella alkaliphila]